MLGAFSNMRDLVLAMLLGLIVTLAVQARKEQSKEFNLIGVGDPQPLDLAWLR